VAFAVSIDRLRFALNRLRDRLWVKPLLVCVLSIAAAFVAKFADGTSMAELVPAIEAASIETLLSIMASSMLVIATFSVASMVSAYASAGNTATPRSFTVVVADDASQNALSTFVGAFIFSVVAITAVKNNYFGPAGLFTLFSLTVIVFGIVIVTFVRWVDRIARLGRLGSTNEKVEKVTTAALQRRRRAPRLHGVAVTTQERGNAVYSEHVGYVQHIDIAPLQTWAKENDARIRIAALPGTFATPSRALVFVSGRDGLLPKADCAAITAAFQIGNDRRFDDDPRFGLIVLAEIAGRALSPAVNDPGTAISVIGIFVRLFVLWNDTAPAADDAGARCDRVEVPEVSMRDMFDDAFTAIGRDGAGAVEIGVRLQKALRALASLGNPEMRDAAQHHSDLALERAHAALDADEDLAAVRGAAQL
jgi:uncharacterized membrane protein